MQVHGVGRNRDTEPIINNVLIKVTLSSCQFLSTTLQAHVISDCRSIVTMALSSIVSDIYPDIGLKSRNLYTDTVGDDPAGIWQR